MLKKLFKKHIAIVSIFSASATIPIILTSCSSTNNFYLANFESYMSPDLMDSIKSEFNNVQYKFYGTNENLERSFDRNYDVAVPSTYLVAKMIEQGKLKQINWSSFGLTYKDEEGNYKNVTNGKEAENLFVSDVTKITNDIYDIKINGKKVSLLDYGVPYFLQDFIFGYKGNEVTDLQKKLDTNSSIMKASWNDIVDHFGNEVGNGKQYNKIAMIDDYRTIYSIPRLIETNNVDMQNGGPTVNPDNELGKVNTIDTYRKTYENLSNKFTEKNTFLLNSDSGTILNDFSNPKGADLGIMYNGDLLYALLGGDEYSDSDNPPFLNNEDNVHYIRPNKTLMALDMLVINKNSKHIDEAHKIIKKIALEGITDQTDGITKTDDNDEYVYGPMVNFDYVTYTSPLKDIYNYVVQESDGYFSYLTEKGYSNNFIKTLIDIFKVESKPSPTNMIEKDLSELDKSNMYYGYLQVRSKL